MAPAVVDGSGRPQVTVQVVRHIRDYMDDYTDLPMDCAAETCLLALALQGHDYEDGYRPLATTVVRGDTTVERNEVFLVELRGRGRSRARARSA